jgi:hypothetical protein
LRHIEFQQKARRHLFLWITYTIFRTFRIDGFF